MEITFDVKEEIINTSFASDWAGCGCGDGGPGIPGTLGTTVTGLTSWRQRHTDRSAQRKLVFGSKKAGGAPPSTTQTHTQPRQALRFSSYLSLIRLDGLLFCGGSATWRCRVHANEPLPACVRAYGRGSWREDGETWVGRPEPGLLSHPPTMRQREEGGAGEGEKEREGGDDGVKGRPTGGSCSPSTFALLYLSTAFPIPTDWKDRGFFPAVLLSGDNHLLLSVPHRQSGLQRTTRQASTWGS